MDERKKYNLRDEKIEDLLIEGIGIEAVIAFLIMLIVSVVGFIAGGGILMKNILALGLCIIIPVMIGVMLIFVEILVHYIMRINKEANGLVRPFEKYYPLTAQLIVFWGWSAFPTILFYYLSFYKISEMLLKLLLTLTVVVIIYHCLVLVFKPFSAQRFLSAHHIEKLILYISEDGHNPIRSQFNKIKQKGTIGFLPFWEYKWLYRYYAEVPCNELWIEGKHDDYNGIVLDVMDECYEKNIDVYRVNIDKGEITAKDRIKRIVGKSYDYKTVLSVGETLDYFHLMSFCREWDWANTSLAEEMKYKYVSETLNKMKDSKEASVVFYQLIKLVEYTYHYMALYEMKNNEEIRDSLKGKTFASSMGLWKSKMQSKAFRKQKIKKETAQEKETLINAYRIVYYAVKAEKTGTNSVTFDDIASRFVELRNNYIGHGTMAFSVSEKLINAMIILAGELVQYFYNTDYILKEDDMFDNNTPYVYKNTDENGKITGFGLLAGVIDNDGTAEYLDYLNGCFYSNNKVNYTLDYEGKPVA